MGTERLPGGIALVRDFRVIWSWGVEEIPYCYSLYGREAPCPRCPLSREPPEEAEIEVNHPVGPREVLHCLSGMQLIVWPGSVTPLCRLPRGTGTAVYSGRGLVESWDGLLARRSGVESGRAIGQSAFRLLQRLGRNRVVRQVERVLQGAPQGSVATDESLVSVVLPSEGRRLYHLLLDLGKLGVLEPDYLLRPCFRYGGSSADLVSRLVTIAESLSWSYDISPRAAEGLSSWILPGVLDRMLAGILKAMAEICPSLWLSCSVVETGQDRWPDAFPGTYYALDFEVATKPDRWNMQQLRGLSDLMLRMGGWVEADDEGSGLRVALPAALPSPQSSVGLVAFGGDEPGFDEVLECADSVGLAVRNAESPGDLARLQPIADGLLLGAAGPMRALPAAAAARLPSQPMMVAGGTVHSAAGPGEPEIRIPLPAQRSTLVSALRRLTGAGLS